MHCHGMGGAVSVRLGKDHLVLLQWHASRTSPATVAEAVAGQSESRKLAAVSMNAPGNIQIYPVLAVLCALCSVNLIS